MLSLRATASKSYIWPCGTSVPVFRIWTWLRRGISVDFQGGVAYGIVRVAHTNRATPTAGILSAQTPAPRYPTGLCCWPRFVRSEACGKANVTTTYPRGNRTKPGRRFKVSCEQPRCMKPGDENYVRIQRAPWLRKITCWRRLGPITSQVSRRSDHAR